MRRHRKVVEEFVRLVFPAADADRVVRGVFQQAQRLPPSNSTSADRVWLLAAARDQACEDGDPSWFAHNAQLVRDGLRAQGELMTDWHAWTDLHRLIDGLEQLPAAQQEMLRLSTLYEDLEPADLAVILRMDPDSVLELLEEATSALRAAFDGGSPGTPGEVMR